LNFSLSTTLLKKLYHTRKSWINLWTLITAVPRERHGADSLCVCSWIINAFDNHLLCCESRCCPYLLRESVPPSTLHRVFDKIHKHDILRNFNEVKKSGFWKNLWYWVGYFPRIKWIKNLRLESYFDSALSHYISTCAGKPFRSWLGRSFC
jgi:hypothetical protein